jgi:hypothetical protein
MFRLAAALVLLAGGSGDGRIPNTAAVRDGARGVGIESDTFPLRSAFDNLKKAGVGDRVRFLNRRESGLETCWRCPSAMSVGRLGASRAKVVGYVIVKLTVTVRIASKPIGAYFHCLMASIADRANASFVDRRTVMSPIVPSE